MNELNLADIAALLNNRDGNGLGGSDGALWLIIILVLFGGWGNRGANYGVGAGGAGGNELYPWLNQADQINGGFRDQMLNSGITGISQSVASGFADVQQALCAGFGGVTNGFAQAEISANARQMASMNQAFNAQTAVTQGLNALQSQQAQCCCDNQLAMANQTATILAEHCADRAALSDATRDNITATNAGVQRILDQLCQDKIDAKNDEIQQLRTQLQIQNLAASQTAQTAQILANNEAQTAALERYLAPNPVPAYVVQNPNCGGVCGFGCGCNAA